jgi:ATP phosphoribosyltransferase
MLRVAVPNKGSLAASACDMLREAGYHQRTDAKELVVTDAANHVEFFYLRPRDIATYVGSGRLDIGITGRDLLADCDAAATEVLALGFARSTFRFAAAPNSFSTVHDLDGTRIATSFPGIVAKYLAEHGVHADSIVRLEGAVETSLRLGVADVIADVVETGTTLAKLGLEVVGEPLMNSEAVVIRPAAALTSANAVDEQAQVFLRRMQSVLVARQYVLMDYDIPADRVDAAVALTPGLESPTVSPLHKQGWFAVRAMVPVTDTPLIMDKLQETGARGILVTAIHSCRL